jgi:outer membrane protein TolC
MRSDDVARAARRRAVRFRFRSPVSRRHATAAIALALAGCAGWSGPLEEQRDALARAERRAETAASAPDPFAGAATLERAALVQAVLERNPTIAAARHAWRAALERAPQEASLDDPMLGFGVAPASFGDTHEVSHPGTRVDLSQRFPFPGKLELRGEAAVAESDAAAHDFDGVRLRLALMASRLYDEYYLSSREVEINAQHVALLEELQRVATARYEVGEATQQDPIQAEVERSHAVHRGVLLATRERVAAEQIQTLLHRDPEAPLPPPPAELALPSELTGEKDALVTDALSARPDVAAASARVRAGESRVDLARREFFPDFTLQAAYDRFWQEEELQPSVGIQVELPFQIARRRAALAQARAELAGAQSERDALVDEARFGVRSSLLRAEESRHVLHLVETEQLPAARDQVEAARTGFETGRSEFFSLIDAQRTLLRVELDREEARADVCRRRAELDRALGRVAGADW